MRRDLLCSAVVLVRLLTVLFPTCNNHTNTTTTLYIIHDSVTAEHSNTSQVRRTAQSSQIKQRHRLARPLNLLPRLVQSVQSAYLSSAGDLALRPQESAKLPYLMHLPT
jgi:hypothetical protein